MTKKNENEHGSTIIVHKKTAPYVMLSKNITNGGGGFSLKALGLLTYLLGKPDGWQTWVNDIAQRFTDGKWAVRSGLNELRALGYADLEPIRGEVGVRGTVWRISDEPIFKDSPRTLKFCLRQQAISPEIAVSLISGNLKLRKPETRKTRVSQNRYLNNNVLLSKEPEPIACSPRLRREDHNDHHQARGDRADNLPLTGLTEKAKSLKAEWSRCHEIVYGVKPKFSPDDLKALNEFEEYIPQSVYNQMALVVMAWSVTKYDSSASVNPAFHCNKISQMPAAWMNFCPWKCCQGKLTGYQVMIAELGWKFTPEQIQKAYGWMAERAALRARLASDKSVVQQDA